MRILAVSQFGAGPFATLNLSDLGAEVVKIEDPTSGGDVSRSVPPYRIEGDSIYFQSWNRNKKSVALNLRTSAGKQVFHDLVSVSAAVFNNLRGDQPSKLGLTYEHLKQFNPRIVCCSLSGFGSHGPRATEPGYDYLLQAATGYMSMTGDPDGPPSACGVSFIDHAAGFAAALGLVSALYAAQQSGVGRDVEVSLMDTAYSMLTYLAAWNLNRGFEPVRHKGSSHQTLVPVQTFKTADGGITIFCGKEKFWRLLCEVFEDTALAEAFPTFEARFRERDAVVARVQAHFLRKNTTEWIKLLQGKVPCAPVRTLAQALADPDAPVLAVEHPTFGSVKQMNTPFTLRGVETRAHVRAPLLGEHTEQVLREWLGYDAQRIEQLKASGALG